MSDVTQAIENLISDQVEERVEALEGGFEDRVEQEVNLRMAGMGRPQTATFTVDLNDDGTINWGDAKAAFSYSGEDVVIGPNGSAVTDNTRLSDNDTVVRSRNLKNG